MAPDVRRALSDLIAVVQMEVECPGAMTTETRRILDGAVAVAGRSLVSGAETETEVRLRSWIAALLPAADHLVEDPDFPGCLWEAPPYPDARP